MTQGHAAVDCAVPVGGRLTDCRVTEEAPSGLGLGDAALAAAATASIANRSPDAPETLRVDFVAVFLDPAPSVRIQVPRAVPVITSAPPIITPAPPSRAPVPAQPRPRFITNPTWARQPVGEFTDRLRASGVTSAFAGLKCRIEANGALSACTVLEESVPDVGLAQAALSAARRARVSPRTVDAAAPDAEVLVWVPFTAPVAVAP